MNDWVKCVQHFEVEISVPVGDQGRHGMEPWSYMESKRINRQVELGHMCLQAAIRWQRLTYVNMEAVFQNIDDDDV